MNANMGYSVFLVDDDKMFLTSLKNSLQQEFGSLLKISEYNTGEKCIEHIFQFHPLDLPPDIVILDYYLNEDNNPDTKDGIKVLQELKSISDDTIVIMLSGTDRLQIVKDSIKNGAYEYIPKSGNFFSNTKTALKNAIDTIELARKSNRYLKWNRNMGIFIISMIIIEVIWYFTTH